MMPGVEQIQLVMVRLTHGHNYNCPGRHSLQVLYCWINCLISLHTWVFIPFKYSDVSVEVKKLVTVVNIGKRYQLLQYRYTTNLCTLVFIKSFHIHFPAVDCGSLDNPTNGIVDTTSGTTFNNMATYSCDGGYEVSGNLSRICGSDGLWSPDPPTCTRK